MNETNAFELRDKKICLSIAGSDPSSGAGIQADLKAFEANGVYGMTVITAITVQTAEKVIGWQAVSTELVKNQLNALLETYPIKYVKTGMLPNKEIIDVVAEAQKKYDLKLIIDPVFVSSSGANLVEPDVEKYYISKLFPICEYLTPNKHEAERLTGMSITNADSVISAGKKLHSLGVKGVLFKGGHIDPEKNIVIDYLYHPEDYLDINMRPRIRAKNENLDVHGTGCNLSAAFCAWMAQMENAFDAMVKTEDYMEGILRKIIVLPDGGKVADTSYTDREIMSMKMVGEVYDFLSKNKQAAQLVAEVRMNISAAEGNVSNVNEVAGIDGRITIINGYPKACGQIKMGASNHTARLLISAKKYDPEIRIVVNVKWKPDWIQKLVNKTELRIHQMNRKEEPSSQKEEESSTMQWAVEDAWKSTNRIPDNIWDDGDYQKEPMIRLFSYDARSCIEKLKLILKIIE